MTGNEGRHVSHRLFLTRCIPENVIPNGLRLKLERTVGNHNETFLNNWCEKLQQHSLGFMKDIITFCDKTITELKAEIENIEKNLKTILESNTFQEAQNTRNFNQTSEIAP